MILFMAGFGVAGALLTYGECVDNGSRYSDEHQWIQSLNLDPQETTHEANRLRKENSERQDIFGRNFIIKYTHSFLTVLELQITPSNYENLSVQSKIELTLQGINEMIPVSPEHYQLSCYVKGQKWFLVFAGKGDGVFAPYYSFSNNTDEERLSIYPRMYSLLVNIRTKGYSFPKLSMNHLFLKGGNINDMVYVDLGLVLPRENNRAPTINKFDTLLLRVFAFFEIKFPLKTTNLQEKDLLTNWRNELRQIVGARTSVEMDKFLSTVEKVRSELEALRQRHGRGSSPAADVPHATASSSASGTSHSIRTRSRTPPGQSKYERKHSRERRHH